MTSRKFPLCQDINVADISRISNLPEQIQGYSAHTWITSLTLQKHRFGFCNWLLDGMWKRDCEEIMIREFEVENVRTHYTSSELLSSTNKNSKSALIIQ